MGKSFESIVCLQASDGGRDPRDEYFPVCITIEAENC